MKVNRDKIGAATLCYLIEGEKILLGEKKHGGAKGKVNGFGGKIEEKDESIFDAIKREFEEETSLKVESPKYTGLIEIYKEGKLVTVFYLFKADKYSGEVKESDEMKVYWLNKDEVDTSKMWPGDRLWFPLYLGHEDILVEMYFKENEDFPYEMKVKFNQKLDEAYHEKFV